MWHVTAKITATVKVETGRRSRCGAVSARRHSAASPVYGSEPRRDVPSALHIVVEPRCERPVVHLAGELDIAGAGAVERSVVEVAGSTVVLDLAALRFLAPAGMGALVRAKQRIEERGNRLLLCNANGLVARAIELAGLHGCLLGEGPDHN